MKVTATPGQHQLCRRATPPRPNWPSATSRAAKALDSGQAVEQRQQLRCGGIGAGASERARRSYIDAERRTVGGKRDVAILQLHPVGNYAVRIVFDDMHSTGIFSWDYLFELGQNRETYWRDYLDELAAKNLSRAPSVH